MLIGVTLLQFIQLKSTLLINIFFFYWKTPNVSLFLISGHHHGLIILAVLDVGLVEDGALVPTGLHHVVDSPVPGHECPLRVLCFRSEGQTSISSLLPEQSESEGDVHRLPVALHHLVLHPQPDLVTRGQAEGVLPLCVEVVIVEADRLAVSHHRAGALRHLASSHSPVLGE